MLPLEASDPEAAALDCVQSFFELIARTEWASAIAMIDRPSSYGRTWTQTDIEHELQAYGTGEVTVTSPALAAGKVHANTGLFDDGSGFYLDFAVPLNGRWSDLTAQFEFKKTASGYAVTLEDIHVL